MKKLLYFFTLFLLTSCNNTAVKKATAFLNPEPQIIEIEVEKVQIQLEENLKMYKSVWDKVINDRQIDLINETSFDENITAIVEPENIVGIEGFKAYYNNYLIGFSDAEFTIIDAFGQGDKIVKHWNFKGTHDGEFFGVPATGNKVDVSGVTLVIMKDGKIAQEQDFMDYLDLYKQLGLM